MKDTPLTQLEDALARINAYKHLVAALEGQLSHHRRLAAKYNEAIATLESERRANALLTEELALLQSKL